jgi:hypothetical protein
MAAANCGSGGRGKKAYGYQEEPTHDDPNRNYIADEPGLDITPENNKVNLQADEGKLDDEFAFISKLLKKESK